MMGQDIKQALGGVGLLVLVAVVGMLAAHFLTGCSPAAQRQAEHAVTAAEYERALDPCVQRAGREETKPAAALAYDVCAAEVDEHWCKTRGIRCGGKR